MINWSRKTDLIGDQSGQARRIAVNLGDSVSTLAEIEQRLRMGEGFTLATLNLDHVAKLRRDGRFREAYARHDLITADGNPIVWISRLAGQPVSLVPGSELVLPVASLAARHDVPVALFGATDEALAAAAARLQTDCPGIKIADLVAPPMGFAPDGEMADAAIERLRGSGARLCFLALGAPKQEIFAVRAAERMPEAGFLSVGAGIDFLGGTQRRAPKVVRVLAAEWAWRLALNPKRLAGRYWACARILPGLVVEALASRRAAERREPT